MGRKRKNGKNETKVAPSKKKIRILKGEREKQSKSSAMAITILHALENHVILNEIFKYVSSADLINLRGVSLKWNDVISSTLMKRKSYMISFDCRFIKGGRSTTKAVPLVSTTPTPEVSSSSTSTIKTKSKQRPTKSILACNMAELNLCIANSKKFPCSAVEIGPGKWNLEDKNLGRFFELCGTKIKVLKLNLNFPQPAESLRNLLFRQLPNVEQLTIKSVTITSSLDSSENPNLVALFPASVGPAYLPSLKSIRFDALNRRQIFQDLLEAAVNLERVENCSVEMAETVKKSGKVSTLKGISIKPMPMLEHPYYDVNSYAHLGILQPKLENLNICCHPLVTTISQFCPVLLSALSNIIHSSSHTIKTLKLSGMPIISKMLQFPVLPSLETMFLGENRRRFQLNTQQRQRIFPPGVVLAECFPNLKRVVLRYPNFSWNVNFIEDRYRGLEEVIDPFSTVESLELQAEVDEYNLDNLYAKFPNIKHIVFANFNFKKSPSNSLWKLPAQVNSIEFRKMRSNLKIKNVDSFFTGFNKEICDNLRIFKRNAKDVDIELLQVMPSIRNAKNLKLLKMVFDSPQNGRSIVQPRFEQKPFISEVSGNYAFNVMPELSIVIVYDFKAPEAKEIARMFEPVKSYVIFAHESKATTGV